MPAFLINIFLITKAYSTVQLQKREWYAYGKVGGMLKNFLKMAREGRKLAV
jgi:hypothetical protein